MSNYWRKKMDELNEQNKSSSKETVTNTSNSSSKSDSSGGYWQTKLDELRSKREMTSTMEDDDIAPPMLGRYSALDPSNNTFMRSRIAEGQREAFKDYTVTPFLNGKYIQDFAVAVDAGADRKGADLDRRASAIRTFAEENKGRLTPEAYSTIGNILTAYDEKYNKDKTLYGKDLTDQLIANETQRKKVEAINKKLSELSDLPDAAKVLAIEDWLKKEGKKLGITKEDLGLVEDMESGKAIIQEDIGSTITDHVLQKGSVADEQKYLFHLNSDRMQDLALQSKMSGYKMMVADEMKTEKPNIDLFDKGTFADGYQAWDVSKAIIGTAGDIGVGATKGILSMAEGLGDLIQYGAAGVAGIAGNEELREGFIDNASTDVVNKFFAPADKYLDDYSMLGSTLNSTSEAIGQIAGIMLTGGLGEIAGLGSAGVSALTTGSMFASGWGSGMSEAYQNGATDGEAVAFGIMAGAADALTELMFGGLGKGVNALGFSKGLSSADDMLAKEVSKNIQNIFIKNGVQGLIKGAGEGVEELTAGLLQAGAQKLTYMSDKDILSLIEDQNLLEQFIVGMLAADGSQLSSNVSSSKTGRDYVTGFNANEQAVIDKVTADAIAEAEKNAEGGKLTKKQEAAIKAEVLEKFKRGGVSTDIIEEMFAEDEYNAWREAETEEETILKEYEELADSPGMELSLNQRKRLEELDSMIEGIRSKTKSGELRAKLDERLGKFMKDSPYFRESYLERERVYQTLEVDTSQYKSEYAKKSVENLVSRKYLNNTYKQRHFAESIAKFASRRKQEVSFTTTEELRTSENAFRAVENFTGDGSQTTFNFKMKQIDGEEYFKPVVTVNGKEVTEGYTIDFEKGEITFETAPTGDVTVQYQKADAVNGFHTEKGVTINLDSPLVWDFLIGHEGYHSIETTDAGKRFSKVMIDYAKETGIYEAMAASRGGTYNEGTDIDSEIVGDLAGQYIFTEDFVNHLAYTERNVAQKILAWIKHQIKMVVAGSPEARRLEQGRYLYEKALDEAAKAGKAKVDAGVKHSLGYHAGDLGKAEFYHQQSGDRGTGHFGTGTYFVGDEAKISGNDTYGKRPHHAVEFDNYNLYKIKNDDDGFSLHRQLKVIDGGVSQEFLDAVKQNKFRPSELRKEALDRAKSYENEDVWDDDLMMFVPGGDFIEAGIQGFTEVAQENGVEVQNYDEWLAAQSDDMPKQGDDDYDFYKYDYYDYLKETIEEADAERNKGYEDFSDAYFKLWMRFGKAKVNDALQAVIEHDKKMRPNGEYDYFTAREQRADSRATIFMKYLGYEGIDVRGTALDNTEYGSVIYDVRDESVKYSLSTDSDGKQLTEGQKEYFKDSKVRDENGNLLRVYHTTENDFTVFDKTHQGEATGDSNTYLGFFFSDDAEYLQNFPVFQNGKTDSYYLNMTNPIDMTNISKDAFLDIVEVLGGDVDTAADVYEEMSLEYGDDPMHLIHLLQETGADATYSNLIEELKPHYSDLMSRGYDGVINYLSEYRGVKEYIVLDSNQAKLTSNEMPTTDPDIRYSLTSELDGETIDEARIVRDERDNKYSLTFSEDIAKGQSNWIVKNEAKAYVTDAELEEAQRVTKAMVDVMMKYSSILPEDKIGKVLTKNGSYDRSVENTTICVRTLAYNEFVDKVQEEIGRPLTQMESFLVSQKLYDIATEPQCLYCYVSLDRKSFNEMLLRYMQDRDTVIAKYNKSDKSKASVDALYEEFRNGRKDTPNMKNRFNSWLKYADNGTQLLSLADIATNERQSTIAAEGGLLADQLADARDYAQKASWSKIQKDYVAYRDEILKLGDRVVKNLNEHYGMRWYSFSDYSAAFIVENMQQITDASIRGLKGLSYTKDTDYAEIFAPSGMNINVSVFVNRDSDGNFVIDPKQSADFEKALRLREKYPNVGIVATVTDDEGLRWAASQEWSDVIIPFHIVRTGTDVAEYYKWLNYTSESGDTIKDQSLWDAYVDSLNRKKVSKNIYPSEHKNNRDTYLRLCESRGLTPRFARFAGEPWYMKLVNETRLSADATPALKPIFDEDAAMASFAKFVDKGGYEGGWYKDGVDVDAEAKLVADDVLAGKKANEVDYGRQDGFDPEAVMTRRKNVRNHGKHSLYNEDMYFPGGTPLRDLKLDDGYIAPPVVGETHDNAIETHDNVIETHDNVIETHDNVIAPPVPEERMDMRSLEGEGDVNPIDKRNAAKATQEAAEAQARENLEMLMGEDQIAPPTPGEGVAPSVETQRETDEDIKITTMEEKLKAKRGNAVTELEKNQLHREWIEAKYDHTLSKLREEYNGLKNKDTKRAAALQRRIARLERIKADILADSTKRISDIEGRISKTDTELQKDHTRADNLERAYARIARDLEAKKATLTEEFAARRAELEKRLGDRGTFYSTEAKKLYDELVGLKKGVRASRELGYLLDMGYDWSSLKTALAHISRFPNRVVNPTSEVENFVREAINEKYVDSSYELSELDSEYNKATAQLDLEAEIERDNARKAHDTLKRTELYAGIMDRIKAKFAELGFDFDRVLKRAKNLSTFATVDNTPQRVMKKALGWKEGDLLADLTVNKIAQDDTEGIKWLNSFTDRKSGELAKLSKKYNIKPGSKKSMAAQMYAEGYYVNEEGEYIKYGDNELKADFPNLKVQENIKGLARDPRIRQIYDETLDAINESRVRNGYPPIPKLKKYFLHFQAMGDFFSKNGIPFNPNDIKVKDLPTDINGMTADLKPGQPYFASAQHREGIRTTFDLLGGLEKYLTSAKNQIYQIDNIQTLRALRNYIADDYGQAKGLESLNSMTEEEAEERIKKVYDAHLSTFAKFLNEEANILAGKTALIDRGLEGFIGRRGMTFMKNLNKQVGANQVGYNVGSPFTNFLADVLAFAKLNKFDFVKGFAQTVTDRFKRIRGKDDGFTGQSSVVIRRKGADKFHRTTWEKIAGPGYALMGITDSISTEIIARAKYNELMRKNEGMTPEQAHYETDKWVSALMGDRSLGQMPQIFNSATLGLITKYQLEVRNQLDSMVYDTVHQAKESSEHLDSKLKRNAATAAKATACFVELAVAQHVFGKVFESIVGYNPAFDIIEAISAAFGWDDDDESEDTFLDNVEQGFLALLEDLPYASVFLDGGRIPASAALPIKEVITGKNSYGQEVPRWKTALGALPYYLMPGGYGQLKKTAAGLGMFGVDLNPLDGDGISLNEDLPISGSYTDSGALRYPVEATPWNVAQAALFGQYASGNARDYFDRGEKPLEEKQIDEFIDSEMTIQEYWDYRAGLKGLKGNEEKLDYINSLDIPLWQKNLFANNILDRKEDVDMEDYGEYDSLDEFDFANKYPEKYAFFTENGISYEDYANADKTTKDAYNWAAKDEDRYAWLTEQGVTLNDPYVYDSEDEKNALNWAYDYPEKYAVSQAITSDVVQYRKYASEIGAFRSSRDANGKEIKGQRAKDKKHDYIFGLDELDYGQQCILWKMTFPKDDEYNEDGKYNDAIVDYLIERDDISADQMREILEALGATITSRNTVKWGD